MAETLNNYKIFIFIRFEIFVVTPELADLTPHYIR